MRWNRPFGGGDVLCGDAGRLSWKALSCGRRVITDKLVTQALVFQKRNDARALERRLAHATFAVQNQNPGIRVIQQSGKTLDIVVPSGE